MDRTEFAGMPRTHGVVRVKGQGTDAIAQLLSGIEMMRVECAARGVDAAQTQFANLEDFGSGSALIARNGHGTGTDARIEKLLSDPGTSFWLKGALKAQLERDVVDAAADAQELYEVMKQRCEETFVLSAPVADELNAKTQFDPTNPMVDTVDVDTVDGANAGGIFSVSDSAVGSALEIDILI